MFSLNPNFVSHLFQRLAALHGETDSCAIERSSFSPNWLKRTSKFVRKLLNKNIDEFNIFLSASIVKIT